MRETTLDLTCWTQSESLFALSNGHIGLRGNLDEGEPYGLPGTYLNSFYETRPLPYAEAGYGYPEDGQSIVDVTNGKLLRLLVDDEPFDVRYGELLEHERVLDMRAGTLTRNASWRSPAGKQVKVRSTRLVSLRNAASPPSSTPSRRSTNSSASPCNPSSSPTRTSPPSSRSPGRRGFDQSVGGRAARNTDSGALLVHRTRGSGLMMAAAMDHDVEVPGRVEVSTDAGEDWARTTVICGLRPGSNCAS